jgi:hypothetical protein
MRNTVAVKRMEMVYRNVAPFMDGRTRQLWAAAEAQAYGWGGIQAVGVATGMLANTIAHAVTRWGENDVC